MLNGVPLIGTTTALNVIAKPLTWWASGLACAEFGWLNPRKNTWQRCFDAAQKKLDEIKEMNLTKYLGLLNIAYRAHNTFKEEAADGGINLHAEVEKFIKQDQLGIQSNGHSAALDPFIEWCRTHVAKFLFSEIHCYSERLWCGGIVDFAYIDKDGRVVLADVKSSREAYFSQFVQMGAYDIQLSENGGVNSDGHKVFELPGQIAAHAVFHFGGGFKGPSIDYGVERNKAAFESALALYRNLQDYEGIMARAKSA